MNAEPDLVVAELRLWISGRQFEAANDYWDGNWIWVKAVCEASGALVSAAGPFVHLSELAAFRDGCQQLHETLSGAAELKCMESNLFVGIQSIGSLGGLALEIHLTEDHLRQRHEFRSEIDQSYLPAILANLNAVLTKFPIRGKP